MLSFDKIVSVMIRDHWLSKTELQEGLEELIASNETLNKQMLESNLERRISPLSIRAYSDSERVRKGSPTLSTGHGCESREISNM